MLNKKFLIIGGIVIIIVVGAIFVFSMLYAPHTSINPSAKSPVFPSITPLSEVNTTPFTSSDISFTTPAKTTVDEAPIAGGGNSVIVNLSESAPQDIIEIQMTPATLTPLDRIYSIMNGFGLKRTDVVVGADQIPAARFQGSVVFGSTTIQQDVIVFEKNDLVYKIQMMYRGTSVNPTYEAQLQQVLSNLKTQ